MVSLCISCEVLPHVVQSHFGKRSKRDLVRRQLGCTWYCFQLTGSYLQWEAHSFGAEPLFGQGFSSSATVIRKGIWNLLSALVLELMLRFISKLFSSFFFFTFSPGNVLIPGPFSYVCSLSRVFHGLHAFNCARKLQKYKFCRQDKIKNEVFRNSHSDSFWFLLRLV